MTPRPRDEGAALVITMMVIVLVTVLATLSLRVTVNDLNASARAKDSSAALDAADAGVAQAMAHLRRSGTHGLRCSPTCPTPGWGQQAQPTSRTLPGTADQSFEAWIEPIAPFPANDPGLYRVHSTGHAGTGVRAVEVDVSVGKIGNVPLGMFGRTIDGAGDYSLLRASVFSTGCVYSRRHIEFTREIDAAYGIPTAVHSSQIINESNGSTQFCPGVKKAVHGDSACNTQFPYDQDLLGGSLAGTPCASAQSTYPEHYGPQDLDGDGQLDVNGSYVRDEAALRTLYGIAEAPFTRPELDALRVLARQQGSYYRSSTGFATPNPAVHPHAVMFFDLLGTPDAGEVVDLKALDESRWGRATNLSADSASCKPQSLIIIIEGGNVRLNAGERLAASVILTSTAPYGKVMKHNGSAELIGTLYGDSIDLSGTGDLSLDECFISNLSPALLHAAVRRYVEVDR